MSEIPELVDEPTVDEAGDSKIVLNGPTVTANVVPWTTQNYLDRGLIPPASSSVDERARELLAEAEKDCGCRIPPPFNEVAEHAISAALRTGDPA